MSPLEEYGELLEEVESVTRRLASLPTASVGCAPGCAECCAPPTLLPLEAMVIRKNCTDTDGRRSASSGGMCPLLTADRKCAAYSARPLVCRVKGFPVVSMDEDGFPLRENCPKNRFPPELGENAAMHLESWNARLFGISARFCALSGIPLQRRSIQDVCAEGSP